MKTSLLLASIVTLVGCSLYDTPTEETRLGGQIVGHRSGVPIYASDSAATAAVTAVPLGGSGAALPASAPSSPPTSAPGAAAPASTPTPACEPGQADCAPPPSAPSPPAR